jgi:hypothetical protein
VARPDETDGTSKKAAVQNKALPALNISQGGRHTKIVASLRAAGKDTDSSGTEATSNEKAAPNNPNVYH